VKCNQVTLSSSAAFCSLSDDYRNRILSALMEYGEVGELSSPLETLRSYGSVISLCSLDRTSYFVPRDTKYIHLCREKSTSSR
jgi:hypothetical protein